MSEEGVARQSSAPSQESNADRPFRARDWTFLAAVALMWGMSFLLIDIGLDDVDPTVVAWLRVVLGALTLAAFPAAWRPVRRREMPKVAVLGVVWMAGPFVLFPLAEQSIPSSLAGMINGAAPLFTLALGAAWARRVPSRRQLLGLLAGFAGVVLVNFPGASAGGASLAGAGLVLLAVFLYGIAFNLAEPLENRNGALPVIWRAMIVAAVVDTPAALIHLPAATFHWEGVVAIAALGVLSTGIAFAAFTTLVGRVGASRGSVATYFVPVVAIVAGALLRDDPITTVAIVGTVLVLVGAYVTTRTPRGRSAHVRTFRGYSLEKCSHPRSACTGNCTPRPSSRAPRRGPRPGSRRSWRPSGSR